MNITAKINVFANSLSLTLYSKQENFSLSSAVNLIMAEFITQDVVSSLLQKSFSAYSFTEKAQIIESDRPKPELPISQNCRSGIVRHFMPETYERIEWLTGSVTDNRLYCWSCLLFNPDKGVWNSKGFVDLSNFSKAAKKHGTSQAHIQSMIQLKTFGKIELTIC